MGYLLEDKGNGILLRVYVQPRASKNRIVGLYGDSLKICITAPPVEGEANRSLVAFLADLFHIPKAAVKLKGGETSRTKTFHLTGLTLATAEAMLREHL